ncbi:MAG: hypothetical protein WED00_01385 [Aquisalimonadaceae bacterium]
MGNAIDRSRFSPDDFRRFSARLRNETLLLRDWLRSGQLADEPARAGYEVEAWLIDHNWRPAPRNAAFLKKLDDPHVVHELAQFNVELNGTPHWLRDQPFTAMAGDLEALWSHCRQVADGMSLQPLMIGILPSARQEDLGLDRMTGADRYRALNEQILQLRSRRPLRIDIANGDEAVHLERADVMLEAASTSLQLHLQLTTANAARCFNAAVIMSAATVAVAANSPLLFGQLLWEETRIPLVEQAVAVDPVDGNQGPGSLRRATFGSGYARDALYQLFVENRQHYPVLLPVIKDDPVERLAHLSLHNGTIWRWNRPLIGADAQGRCHLRLEHRVMSAGPSIVDMTANAAFFHGLVQACLLRDQPLETEIPFAVAERNFYRAAREGLAAEMEWLGGSRVPLRELILESLIPKARRGLEQLDLPASEYGPWLEIIEARVRTGRTGAAWQRAWVHRHGRDMQGLVAAYWQRQRGGAPVHEWEL